MEHLASRQTKPTILEPSRPHISSENVRTLPSGLVQQGALAQLGERLICIQEVRSSILLGSTKPFAEQKASPWQSLRSNDEKGSV